MLLHFILKIKTSQGIKDPKGEDGGRLISVQVSVAQTWPHQAVASVFTLLSAFYRDADATSALTSPSPTRLILVLSPVPLRTLGLNLSE